ncbi:MAG: ATP-binding protein [Desulfobacterota bacterium]|nr:ATP-binding protein [Thermodesulfobacteriota bacterium]MDW8002105.1 ATP-binding protein [Deltaproteobacteria bacterium]
MRGKKGLKAAIFFAIAFVALFYLETQLPYFKKFLPVEENKLVLVLLNVNLLLILLLVFLITRTFMKAYIEKKRGIWGSGLKLKLISTLLFISIVPSFTLFVLASGFFQVSMDKWFGQKIEDAIDSAYEVYETYKEEIFERQERVLKYLKASYEKNSPLNTSLIESVLREEKKKGAFDYFLVVDGDGKKICGNFPPNIEESLVRNMAELKGRENKARYVLKDEKGEVHVAGDGIRSKNDTLELAIFLGESSKIRASEKFKEMTVFQKEFKKSRAYKKLVKYSFFIPLSIVTIITVFFSIWVGMKLATAISVPIERVKEGASIIAKGKFDINLEDKTKDEIGTLVSAFNAMARQLKIVTDELEEKRRYMEVILDNVATGIISTDRNGNVLLLNRAAKSILGVEGESWKNRPIMQIVGEDLRPFVRLFLRELKRESGKTVMRDLKLNLKNKVTHVRASITALCGDQGSPEGFIIAIDDITHVIQAERLSLWQEVAKKLTHEIKNPLTPILLSAERLRRKFLKSLSGKDKEVLDESTRVIINSADVIKGIVNDLTRIAPYPASKKEEDLNGIVEEAIDLYKNVVPNVLIKFEKGEIPPVFCDREGIKRVLLNLVTNSLKAIDSEEGIIEIRTHKDTESGYITLEVADNGKGIADEDKPRIFDPYFTKDKEGTGLGLAIVNSIVLEHHGSIEVKDNHPKGTRFIIRLPIAHT